MAKVTGREKLKRKLAALPPRVRDQMRRDIQVSAEELVGLQRRLAPVVTGHLRDSLKWKWHRGEDEAAGSEIAAKVFSDDFKARFVEFGTAAHGEHPGTASRPFFFPAYRALRKKIKSRIARGTSKALKEVAQS
jgi:hypothetical protein